MDYIKEYPEVDHRSLVRNLPHGPIQHFDSVVETHC